MVVAGAGAVAAFFVGVTPWIHDFWNMEDEQRQQQMNNLLRNTAFLGAAITFLIRGANDNTSSGNSHSDDVK